MVAINQEVADKRGVPGFPWVSKRAYTRLLRVLDIKKKVLRELLTRVEKKTCRILSTQEEAEVKKKSNKKS